MDWPTIAFGVVCVLGAVVQIHWYLDATAGEVPWYDAGFPFIGEGKE
ncbi:hypothetical protein ACFQL1_15000 [Halomicroarcula sp. GCM10025709]|nr:hypothetical protein [Halomicroarcula sp. YJ-61-S]